MRSPQAPARPRGPLNRRRYDPEALIAAGKWSKEQQAKITKVMREFKAGTLKSRDGSKVTNKRQALAIALSEARSLTAAGKWDESKHPRDPGGEGGGQWIGKGEGAADEGPSNDERDSFNAGHQDMLDGAKAEAWGPEDILAEWDEIHMDPDRYGESDEAYVAGQKDALQELASQAGVELPSEEEIRAGYEGAEEDDGEVDPYATDYDEAGGDEVQLSPEEFVAQERADIEGRVARGELTSTEGQQLTEQAWAEYQRRKGQTASAMTASAAGLAPLVPPRSWFDKPELEGPTAITITADGQVFGHAALWGTCHTGMPGVCRTPPRSSSDYAYFHLGEVETDDGPVAVGRVTMDTGHAPLTASRDGAVRHYDHTGTQIAHVRAYEDDHGIVLAGALVPDAPAEKARRFKGATVSGDWRSIQGKLEMVGMLAVNVPGFPVPRAMAASLVVEDEPHTMALVAAGVYCSPEEEARKLKALTARALGGVEGLAAAAGYEDKARRRMGVTAAAWDESKHPRGGKGTHEGGKFVSKKQGTTPTEGDKKPGDMTPDEYAAHMEKIQEDYAAERRGVIKSEPDSIGLARDLGGQEVAPGMEIVDQSYDVTPPGGKVARRHGYFSLRDKATGAEMTALPSNATVTKTELGHIRAAFDAAEAVDLSKPKTELASILNKTNMKQNGVFRVRLIDRLAAANRNPFRKGSMDWEMVQHYVDNPNPRSGFDKT